MKTLVSLTCILIISIQINAQTLCKSQVVMPIAQFDQCNDNPLILVFEKIVKKE